MFVLKIFYRLGGYSICHFYWPLICTVLWWLKSKIINIFVKKIKEKSKNKSALVLKMQTIYGQLDANRFSWVLCWKWLHTCWRVIFIEIIHQCMNAKYTAWTYAYFFRNKSLWWKKISELNLLSVRLRIFISLQSQFYQGKFVC